MLKRAREQAGNRITFTLETDRPTSVVGDFNGWDPFAHRLVRRSTGVRSVAVTLPAGRYAFRYLADGGEFFDDPAADHVEPNGFGETHSVLLIG